MKERVKTSRDQWAPYQELKEPTPHNVVRGDLERVRDHSKPHCLQRIVETPALFRRIPLLQSQLLLLRFRRVPERSTSRARSLKRGRRDEFSEQITLRTPGIPRPRLPVNFFPQDTHLLRAASHPLTPNVIFFFDVVVSHGLGQSGRSPRRPAPGFP